MSRSIQVDELATEILDGSDRSLSRGLTWVERGGPASEDLLDRLYSHTGRAHIVGLTGSPGAGKSTLTAVLARAAVKRGLKVGVIAIDPSSPYSGGSILGDRIRMNDVAFEMNVFVRSLATHGALGGLSRATADSIDLMDAAGKELILVETVGVGQDEVDVMETVHTVVVLSVPGLGDEIQTLKAGILEIADIHVVNKADREGANRIKAELRSMLALNGSAKSSWHPPIISCVAVKNDGTEALLDSLKEHLNFLKVSSEFDQRRKEMVKAHVLAIAHELVSEGTTQKCESDDLLERVVKRELAPHAAGRTLLARLVSQRGDSRNV